MGVKLGISRRQERQKFCDVAGIHAGVLQQPEYGAGMADVVPRQNRPGTGGKKAKDGGVAEAI